MILTLHLIVITINKQFELYLPLVVYIANQYIHNCSYVLLLYDSFFTKFACNFLRCKFSDEYNMNFVLCFSSKFWWLSCNVLFFNYGTSSLLINKFNLC